MYNFFNDSTLTLAAKLMHLVYLKIANNIAIVNQNDSKPLVAELEY